MNHRDGTAHKILLAVAIGVAWFPVETQPLTGVAIVAAVLALSTWGWRRSSGATVSGLAGSAVALVVLILSGASGWDPASAVGAMGMVAAAVCLAWLASRSRTPNGLTFLFSVGLASLAVWGLWQLAAGFEVMISGLDTLPDTAKVYAEERISSRRAFASLPLPSHLAVLLATALPLLVTRIRSTGTGVVAAIGTVLVMAGLVATKSPVGIGLALAAVAAVVVRRNRGLAFGTAGLLSIALVAAVVIRPDVGRLEPVDLRVDNWRTALWLFETSPVTGVGLSGFAQASQALPLDVGNRPAHAHNLVLESLAEFGITGFISCLLMGVWLLRVIMALWPRDPAMAAALAVVPLHNLVDFSFFVSGVVLPWAVLLGWALVRIRTGEEVTHEVRGRILLVIAASVGVALSVLHGTSIIVEEAAASEVETADRFDGGLRSLQLAPWRVEPQFLLASAALESGDLKLLDRAWAELERHRWWRPGSAALTERRARVALARGDVSAAASEFWISVEAGKPEMKREEALRILFADHRIESYETPD